MNKIYILIFGMMFVTYLPRLIPFYLMSGKKLPCKFENFLFNIPFAALGALILPGCIYAIHEHKIVSIIGVTISLLLGYTKGGVIIPVLGSIGSCMMMLYFGF